MEAGEVPAGEHRPRWVWDLLPLGALQGLSAPGGAGAAGTFPSKKCLLGPLAIRQCPPALPTRLHRTLTGSVQRGEGQAVSLVINLSLCSGL